MKMTYYKVTVECDTDQHEMMARVMKAVSTIDDVSQMFSTPGAGLRWSHWWLTKDEGTAHSVAQKISSEGLSRVRVVRIEETLIIGHDVF